MRISDYYPFGLTMAGISSRAIGKTENKFKFNNGSELQSKEFSDGSGLELYDAKFRSYDPQIGRFHQMDPLADMSMNISPFAFGNNNPILLNDPLGLMADSLPAVTVIGYIKNKANDFSNWFSGANVGYQGSGWGHGPRQALASACGLGNNANNLAELGMHSQLQSSHVNLTGGLLNRIKADPAMVAFQKKIIALLKADPRFKNISFVQKGQDGVEFGGKRWSSADENWGALDNSNPLLHSETLDVATNPLTWSLRHASVEYSATVKTDGTTVISYHLSDRLDLSAQPGRSEAYNNISATTGFMYHDVLGGNSGMQVNADWQTTIK
ncbi:MAG: RHS repeat-associated core domain-containing protein [Flavitalea sp.]